MVETKSARALRMTRGIILEYACVVEAGCQRMCVMIYLLLSKLMIRTAFRCKERIDLSVKDEKNVKSECPSKE